MNKYEKDEITRLPNKYKPIGAWGYFGYKILFAIPVIGFICLLIFAFSGSNVNRRSFARSYFCVYLVVLVITIILGVVAYFLLKDVLVEVKDMIVEYWNMLKDMLQN